MKVMFRGLVKFAAALLMTTFAASNAQAAAVIEFDDAVFKGGTVIKSGTIITGTDILFDTITFGDGATITDAAQCGATADATTVCVLNFSFDTSTNTGTISMTALGGLYDAGGDNLPFTADTGAQFMANGSTVLSGTLTEAIFGNTGFIGSGTDDKAPELLDFFGIFVLGEFTFTNTEIKTLRGQVQDADLVNSAEANFIPEPGLLSLFGLGLLGVGRRFAKGRK
jgi:hypothetical protein